MKTPHFYDFNFSFLLTLKPDSRLRRVHFRSEMSQCLLHINSMNYLHCLLSVLVDSDTLRDYRSSISH